MIASCQTKKASWETDRFDQSCTIESNGTGRIYFLATERGYGKKELVKPYNKQLTVQRIWSDRNGLPVDTQNLRVGDLIIEADGKAVKSISDFEAVVGSLPAGKVLRLLIQRQATLLYTTVTLE